MRFGLLIAAISGLLILPYAAHQFVVALPLWLELVLLPFAEGLHYAAVAVHESSHAAADYLLGYPALPVFDVAHGGGSTYSWPKNIALAVAVDAAMAELFIFCRRQKYYRACLALVALMSLQPIIWLAQLDAVVITAMGHMGEVMAGSFFILLARRFKSRQDRGVLLVIAIHLYLRVVLLALGLLLSDARQQTYALQKGVPGSGDLTALGRALQVPVSTIALAYLIFTLTAAGFTAWRLWRARVKPPSSSGACGC